MNNILSKVSIIELVGEITFFRIILFIEILAVIFFCRLESKNDFDGNNLAMIFILLVAILLTILRLWQCKKTIGYVLNSNKFSDAVEDLSHLRSQFVTRIKFSICLLLVCLISFICTFIPLFINVKYGANLDYQILASVAGSLFLYAGFLKYRETKRVVKMLSIIN